MEQHILVLNKTSLNDNTCYSLTSSRKLLRRIYCLHLVKEVCASNSSVILQSLHTLLQCNMDIKDNFIINGTFFINFNTDKFKVCAVFLKQWLNPSITSGGNNDYVIKGWNIHSPACLWQVVFLWVKWWSHMTFVWRIYRHWEV